MCRKMVAAPGKHLLHVWLGNGVSVTPRSELERCGAAYPQVRISAQACRGTRRMTWRSDWPAPTRRHATAASQGVLFQCLSTPSICSSINARPG